MENQGFLERSLGEIGLTQEQAKIYKVVVELGAAKAFKVSLASGVKRALTYKVLNQLMELDLIYSKETLKDKVLTFYPIHPSSLAKLINQKREKAEAARHSFDQIIQSLTSAYNLTNKKPDVQFFEGVAGIQYVFDDIIRMRCDFLLFRSYLDNTDEKISAMIDEQRRRQTRLGIKIRLISSRVPDKNLIERDMGAGITRRYVPVEKFSLPAQITVYGDKVAITSYKEPIITTVIENPEIRNSFTALFELIWVQAQDPTNFSAVFWKADG